MRAPIYLSLIVAALALAVPAAAQQDGGSDARLKQVARTRKPPAPAASGQGAFMGNCGDWFRCYTGIPLRCGENTRPFQDIANHACFCVHDGCPQQ
ncbi:MAG TPA: hypothetical protein VKW08_27575 [Xanthobacteraceae bacterium]|jgi:hypothetical protein|nr:hypothetical protein [Xanthobacteraceae bacterium]